MSNIRKRPLSVGPIRSFEAVARLLNFREAAEEQHVTQSAVSRQIQSLEQELGAPLFVRGTRHVELTAAGSALLRAVAPWLDRLDATVRQIRNARGRQVVTVTTFASFASLWLIPRLEAFQRQHPDIDIRVSAYDALADLGDPDIDIALRYCSRAIAPPGAEELFGEILTPVVCSWLAEQARSGQSAPLNAAADLAGHTLIEEDDDRPSAQFLTWRHWLAQQNLPQLEPRRWMYLNFTYQQVQAALTGQGVALGRLALIAEQLERGELVEPFGPEGRIDSPALYWMAIADASRQRPEVMQFRQWVSEQAALTRAATPGRTLGVTPAAPAGLRLTS